MEKRCRVKPAVIATGAAAPTKLLIPSLKLDLHATCENIGYRSAIGLSAFDTSDRQGRFSLAALSSYPCRNPWQWHIQVMSMGTQHSSVYLHPDELTSIFG